MMKRECIGGIGLVFLIAVLCSPVTTLGQYVSINVQVSGSDAVSQTFVTNIDWEDVYANPDDRYTWNLQDYYPEGYTFDLGTHTATIESLSVAVEADPTVQLGFSAVSHNGPATFLFSSDVLNFAPLTNASAYVYAEAGSLPGTTVSAVNFPGKLCRALYNGTDIFADVVNPFSFVPGGTYEYIPSTAIAGQVSSMQVMWSLNVNSGGHADGLCTFELSGTAIPEPATMVLLGLGGLALLRKRSA